MFRAFFPARQEGRLTTDGMAALALTYGQEFVGPPL